MVRHCKFCGRIAKSEYKYNGMPLYLCEDCEKNYVHKCEDCGKEYFYHEWFDNCLIQPVDNKYYCNNCLQHHFKHCPHCDRQNNWITKDSNMCFYCASDDYIHSYGFKPSPIFHKSQKENTNLFVGVELELNFNHSANGVKFMQHIGKIDENSFVYLKHDGSLEKYGIEIVSHPATFAYHLKCNNWKDIFSYLHDTNTNNCGMHLHLSKNAFSKDETQLLDYMVNNYKHLIVNIGSRKLAGYCRAVKSISWGNERCSSHTDACNLTNEHTIELRFCKATNNYNTFIKKIKNVYTLISFVKTVCNQGYKNKIMNSEKTKVEKFFEYFKGELLSRI